MEPLQVSIVMYHYVRDLQNSLYPEIKGLDVSLFETQLRYFIKYHNVIRMENLIDVFKWGRTTLPRNPVLLTFDDGYKDHYQHVFPILDELGLQGSFFPPAQAITERKVLDVNKIQFILASQPNKEEVMDEIFDLMDTFSGEYTLLDKLQYRDTCAVPDRFDSKEVVFIKRMLQKELPAQVRKEITDSLFKKYVSKNERAFSEELYMNIHQVRCMRRHGMFFGSHGYNHLWLPDLSASEQISEIDKSMKFLESAGASLQNWVMCYPYGAHNETLQSILQERQCAIGLTTKPDVATLSYENRLALPRMDTNDYPKVF